MNKVMFIASVLFLVGCTDNSEYEAALADCVANERNPMFDQLRKDNSLAATMTIKMGCEGMLLELAE